MTRRPQHLGVVYREYIALTVSCGHCNARRGRPCKTPRGGLYTHIDRYTTAVKRWASAHGPCVACAAGRYRIGRHGPKCPLRKST